MSTLEEILYTYVAPILGGILTFITGGGLIKVIREIKKNGKKANWKEISKEVKKSFRSARKLRKTLDKEIKKVAKDQ